MGLSNSLATLRLHTTTLWGGDRGGRLPLVLLAVVPIVAPAAYVAYVLGQGARRTIASASITPPDPLTGRKRVKAARGNDAVEASKGEMDTLAIPADVLAEADTYVISRERIVSEAIALDRILPALRSGLADSDDESEEDEEEEEEPRDLLETYLATTMRMFTWTPQAYGMKAMVARIPDAGEAHAKTFTIPYLDACLFEEGDRVCGVYVVREHVSSSKGERIFLDLSAPAGWTGPDVKGVLDCGFLFGQDAEGGRVIRFVNETVMWRRKDGEKPTLLEGGFARRLHAWMVGWMMVRGIESVTLPGGATIPRGKGEKKVGRG